MRDISRRIEKAEKKLNVGKEPKVIYVINQCPYPEGTVPCFEEGFREWQTFKAEEEKAKEIAKACGLGIAAFKIDPLREYEVRNNLPEGKLTKHKLAGKIPFDRLVKTTKIDQKQPKTGIIFNW